MISDQKISELVAATTLANGDDLLLRRGSSNLRADFDLLQAGSVVHPEWYGATGGNPAVDTPAIQAAINDLETRGGGILKLTQNYHLQEAGTTQLGGYTSDYAIWINGSNIWIEGPGTLTLPAKPTSTQFVGVLFGNGGASGSWPGEGGTWIENVGIRNVRFDASALSQADRLDISQNDLAATVLFAYVKHFWAEDLTIIDGWGWPGCLMSHVSSRYGRIVKNLLTSPLHQGIRCDGGRYIQINQNTLIDVYADGIVIGANLDQGTSGTALHNAIVANIIDGVGLQAASGSGIILTCSDTLVNANHIFGEETSYIAVLIGVGHTPSGKSEASRNLVFGNYSWRPAGAAGVGFFASIIGEDSNSFDATPLEAADNFITGNYANSEHDAFVNVIGEQANRNTVINNHGPGIDYGSINATAIGNKLAPNFGEGFYFSSQRFADGDATPDISKYRHWVTANTGPTTITDFNGGYAGQEIVVKINDANTTIDFTASGLKGNGGADWSPGVDDFMKAFYDGTDWLCEVHET